MVVLSTKTTPVVLAVLRSKSVSNNISVFKSTQRKLK